MGDPLLLFKVIVVLTAIVFNDLEGHKESWRSRVRKTIEGGLGDEEVGEIRIAECTPCL